MMDRIMAVNGVINSFVWGPVMLVLLVGTGVFLTFRTNFLQMRKFGYIMRHTICTLFHKRSKDHGNNLSPFQAVTTALASTVGTGNIAGVTGAVFLGGPGAVFWMWISAIFGMCTKYAEIALSIRFRETGADGTHKGGPMYYIEKGLGQKWKFLAVLFALLAGIASFGIGNIAQASEIGGAMKNMFGVEPIITGVVLAILVAIIILGGVKRIGQVTSYMVPFMALFYVVAGIAVIVLRFDQVPAALALIFKSAFNMEAVGGGIFGYGFMVAMRQGFARGVFSNEAGLGSAPIAHAASSTNEPVEQAMWGVFEVFIDTFIICTITALTTILSGVYALPGGLENYVSNGAAAAAAFNSILPGTLGGSVINLSIIFFSLSTLVGWSYYGERCWGYLTHDNKKAILTFKLVYIVVALLGTVGSGTLMWEITDTLNGMMAIPNLIGLLLLSGVVAQITRDYFSKHK